MQNCQLNLAQIIQTVNRWGIDISSGIEASKEKKDHVKLKALIQKAKVTTTHQPLINIAKK